MQENKNQKNTNQNHENNLKKSTWGRFKEYIKTLQGKRTLLLSILILAILIFAAVMIYKRYFTKDKNSVVGSKPLPSFNYQKENVEKKEICKLDGLLHPAQTANRHPLAVMIENHPDARPQSGLDKANIIYEAIAEGGITRFMAIYGPDAPEKVGPVRSARTFYLDWGLEYSAYYAHVGGNIDALDLIPKLGIKDLDQFKYGSQAYWRESQKGKATEHTMFTNTVKLYGIAQDNGWDVNSSDFTMLEFKDDAQKNQRPISQSIEVNFSTDTYKVSWEYDPNNNLYKRFMAGTIHKDAISSEQLTAKNVIVQEVKRAPTITRINEQGWDMTTVGEGNAKVFLDGKMIEGSWKKKDENSRTLFYDADGNKIKFNAGKFWYEIVPPETPITVK